MDSEPPGISGRLLSDRSREFGLASQRLVYVLDTRSQLQQAGGHVGPVRRLDNMEGR